jgi:hypothetical protein
MNAKAVIHGGIALICLGIAALSYPGVPRMSKTVEIADQQSGMDTQKTIYVSSLAGGLLLIGGVVLVVIGAKTSRPR